jgi:hypothetical protein
MRIDLKDLFPGLCGLGFGAWLLRETYLLDVELAQHVGGGMNAAGYPRLLALLILGFSMFLVCQALIRSVRRQVPPSDGSQLGDTWVFKKAGIAFLGFLVYTLLLNHVGYLIITPPLLGLIVVLVGERRKLVIAATAILITLVLYTVTFYAFHIVLPEGVLRYVIG